MPRPSSLALLFVTASWILACAGGTDDKPGLFDDKDVDGDGYLWDEDCDDENPDVNPGATERCDPVDLDEDCDGRADNFDDDVDGAIDAFHDADGDAFGDPDAPARVCEAGGGYVTDATDCDDGDAAVSPAAQEVCDGAIDEDCDGAVDDADDTVADAGRIDVWEDADGDGYGAGDVLRACAVGVGFVGFADDADDCDDADAGVNPASYETCGGADEDCDGTVDEDDALGAPEWYADADDDGYGDEGAPRAACEAPAGYVAIVGDCDDADADASPDGVELCDGDDDDCDGTTDEDDAADAPRWYLDADRDGYGEAGASVVDCFEPTGYVAAATDCDDGDAGVHPGASEECDAANVDEDCDGLEDGADGSAGASGRARFYADDDGDGYGDASASVLTCDAPSGYVSDATDCEDDNAAAHPGGAEVCDAANLDEDCDGSADDADATVSAGTRSTFYRDADGDTYGLSTSTVTQCDAPAGYATRATDCDDADADANPGEQEICDAANVDEDCDGNADDADGSVLASTKSSFWLDADGDDYGTGSAISRCDAPAGYGPYPNDCDDADATSNPGELDQCFDAVDQDCDGEVRCDRTGSDADRTFWGEAANDIVSGTWSAGDMTGDGVADILLEASATDTLYVVAGGGSGDTSLSAARTTITGGSALGMSVASMGDVDGDGDDELLAGAYGSSRAYYFEAPLAAGDISSTSARGTFTGDYRDGTGYAVGNAGDVDGDGRADALVTASAASSSYGQEVYLFTSMPTGTVYTSSAVATIRGNYSTDYTGIALCGADLDGDGYSDAIIGSSGASRVAVFNGPFSGTIDIDYEDSLLTGEAGGPVGSELSTGDTDMDGYADIAIGSSQYGSDGAAYIVRGPLASGSTSLSAASVRILGDTTQATFGTGVKLDGDLDGDGRSDLLVSDYSANRGEAFVFLGALSGTYSSEDADLLLEGAYTGDNFGSDMAWIPSATGTTSDILISDQREDTGGSDAGAAYLFLASGF